jgi:hypothetical protein
MDCSLLCALLESVCIFDGKHESIDQIPASAIHECVNTYP